MSKKGQPIYFQNTGWAKFLTEEQREHGRLVELLGYKHRDALWFHAMNEGKRSKFEQWLWKIMGGQASVPDFLFLDPRHGYVGLAIELKPKETGIFRKDGAPYSDKVAQHDFLVKLQNRGWFATFACGCDQAWEFVEAYYGDGKLKPAMI